MKVQDCMTKSTISVKPSENIYQVAKIMGDNHIGCVPVCDNLGKVVGILTDRDILLRRVVCNKDANTTPISDIMTTKVVRVSPDVEMNDVADIMAKNQIRRIPVVIDEKVVGIVSFENLTQDSNIGNQKLGDIIDKICDNTGKTYHNS